MIILILALALHLPTRIPHPAPPPRCPGSLHFQPLKPFVL